MLGNEGDRTGSSIEIARYRLSHNKDEMIHAEIRALYSYWERIRAGRPCPYRAEVDPRDMTGDARHLFVLEDLGEGNLRFRLAGTALTDAFGYELRGMNVRSVMAGRARESFVALLAETMAEPGVGYARLLAPDKVSVWEIVLLPLRGDFGKVDRIIGCLHPVSGRTPVAGDEPLRFAIDEMMIQPVIKPGDVEHGDVMPLPGFAEPTTEFEVAARGGLTSIDGGRAHAENGGHEDGSAARANLRLVRDED